MATRTAILPSALSISALVMIGLNLAGVQGAESTSPPSLDCSGPDVIVGEFTYDSAVAESQLLGTAEESATAVVDGPILAGSTSHGLDVETLPPSGGESTAVVTDNSGDTMALITSEGLPEQGWRPERIEACP
jgi:hypothetical protein